MRLTITDLPNWPLFVAGRATARSNDPGDHLKAEKGARIRHWIQCPEARNGS